MSENGFMVQLLYGTKPGRRFMEWLLKSKVDAQVVRFLCSPISKIVIRPYIWMNKIPMEEFAGQKYGCFRDFFVREREPREIDENPAHLVSPCDGWLSAFPIETDSSFYIKGSHYRLEDLIQDMEIAKAFYEGTCLIFRLCASDYHHYSYIDSGYQGENHYIPGMLHSVQPAACENYPVYTLNRRVWTLLQTENFGPVIQTEIGAFVVGGIVNEKENTHVARGMEKGRFELAGSTIVLLFQKNQIQISEHIRRILEEGKEFRVLQGMKIGEKYEK